MTRPGEPSSRGRHSAPEEGPGRHAAPEDAPAPPGRRRHAAPDFSGGYGDGPSRRRHAADDDEVVAGPPDGYWGVPAAYQAEGPDALGSRHRAEPDGYDPEPAWPVNGHGVEPPQVNGHHVGPLNGHGPRANGSHGSPLDGYRDEPAVTGFHGVEPVAGFPFTTPAIDSGTAWPVNGHGLDAAERDAAEWPVNGHTAIPPLNGHGANGYAWPVNGTDRPRDDEPEPRANGASAWPLNGHSGMNGHSVNGRSAIYEPGVNGHSEVNGHSAVDGYAGVDGHAGVNGHPAVNGHSGGDGVAPLAGWQRQPFRPSYPTALQRDVSAPALPPTAVPPPTVLPPAEPPATVLPPATPPATDRPSAPPPIATGLNGTFPPTAAGLNGTPPATAAGLNGAPPATAAGLNGTLPPTATGLNGTLPPMAAGPVAAPDQVRPEPVGPAGAPAAFALDADDESTQVLRRYVPASETLGRERSERPAGRPVRPPHPPRAVVRRRQARRRRLEWPFLIVFALLSAYLIRAYVVQTFYIPSASMHETLLEGDRVLVNKISYKVHDVHRGDVIVFTKPPKLTADEDDLIKRVVALPGETVEGRGGKVYINGAPLTEPYVAPTCSVNTSDFAPLKVPAGDLWVMGDNRCNSADSRFFGVIDEHTVVGRAFVLVWPVGRFSGL